MQEQFADFDPSQMHAALQQAAWAAENNQLNDNGLTPLSTVRGADPLAWVDELGQVWPHPAGAVQHGHIKYLFSPDEVAQAMQESRGIIVVSTVPSSVVPQVTGEAPPPPMPDVSQASVVKAARSRQAMLATFANPAGAAVRSE